MGGSRLKAAVAGVAVCALVFALPALAATATGKQDPNLTVSLTVTVSGKSTQVVNVSGYVLNNAKTPLSVAVTASLTGPLGNSGSNTSTSTLRSRQRLSSRYMILVKPTDPRGTYTLSLSASENGKTSSATLSVTIK